MRARHSDTMRQNLITQAGLRSGPHRDVPEVPHTPDGQLGLAKIRDSGDSRDKVLEREVDYNLQRSSAVDIRLYLYKMVTVENDLLWEPAHLEKAQSTLFRKHIEQAYGVKLDTYEDLLKWTFANTGPFWSEVWDWEGVIGDKGDGPVRYCLPQEGSH